MKSNPPRVVLDTNACLDLWVFADPRAAHLLAALEDGTLRAITNASCREEWQRVLRYPQLQLTEPTRRVATAAYDALVQCLPDDGTPLRIDVSLPRCADPDDQKFLELALSAGARWLISRDADVLALGRRTLRDGLFEIVPPQAWTMTAA